MDLLLTHGYFLFEDPAERKVMKPYPPLGILYLSAYLKTRGFEVELFDSTFESLQAFETYLARLRPPVVGLYANLMTKARVLRMMRLAKKQGCHVVVGGPDPPYYAEEYLAHGADVVVIGEGEQTLEALLPELQRGNTTRLEHIAGLAYRDEFGRVRRTPPRTLLPHLDALPLPDREAISLQRYMHTWKKHHGLSSISLITARGCPYTCTWCSHSVFGRSLRKRAPENVAEEVQGLIERYQPDMLWYADDVFNIHAKWFYAYARELKRRNIAIPFECICRADRLDEQLLQTLKQMGCFRMWIGSESGSQRLLDRMKRGVRAEQVQAMTRMARKYGIETGMFLMWGYEDETEQDIRETIEHVKKAHPDIVLTTVSYPIKGTEYYERMHRQHAIIADRPWETSTDRDYRIRGRHSKRYYYFVNRWLYGELALSNGHSEGAANWLKIGKAHLNARLGRWGMRLTAGQKEG